MTERPGNKFWTTKDKVQIGTHEMGRDHLENTLAMLMRKVMTDDSHVGAELLDTPLQHPKHQRMPIPNAKLRLERMRKWIAHLQAELEWRDRDMVSALDKPGARRPGSRFPNWKPD